MIVLQRYDINIVCKKGKELYVADTLSRAYQPDDLMDIGEDQFEVMAISPVSSTRQTELRDCAANDPGYMKLYTTVKDGWPRSMKNIHKDIRCYFPMRDELSISENLVLRGERIIVPSMLRRDYLARIHLGHPGAEACKRRASETIYWPSIDDDITEFVKNCQHCNALKPYQQKEELNSYKTPALPWETVATDIFEWNSMQYLVVVDSYSNWLEFCTLSDMKSKTVICKLKCIFATHGIPVTLISDNGRQFVSEEFEQFMKGYDIIHTTSSPGHPQGNGFAERAVQSAKSLLEKTNHDGSDLYLNLLNLRNIPRSKALRSPAQRLMSRSTRAVLPMTKTVLKPKVVKNVNKNLKRVRAQKKYFDKNAKTLPVLYPEQPVRMRSKTNTEYDKEGVIKGNHNGNPRSYVVEAGGKQYVRNRRDILQVPVNKPPTPSTPNKPMSASTTQQDNSTADVPEATVENKLQATNPQPEPQATKTQILDENPRPEVKSPYVTRSGRISKPNPRYMDEVFV